MRRDYKTNNCLEYLEISAERFPDKISFADEKESVTFVQLRDAAMRIGSALRQFDLHKDPVVILMDADHINHTKLANLYKMVSDKKAKIWCMIPKYDPRTGDSEKVFFFDAKSISFLEKPNNIITGKFVSNSFDVLIDLTRKESLPLKYLASISAAHCKCGLDKPFFDFYDLKMSMQGNPSEEQLLEQILFYLKTIGTKA